MQNGIEVAAIGLVGVVVGAVITTAKEWWFQHRKNKKEAEYLAIRVVCMLDTYVVGCAAVVQDGGVYENPNIPSVLGNNHVQVPVPEFDPEVAKVEWKTLPADLMYEILSLPIEIEAADRSINDAKEYVAMPPDFDEFFEERQYQYAQLGIKASNLAAKLREFANLPRKSCAKWDPVEYMEKEKLKIEFAREQHEASHALMLNGLTTNAAPQA
jgi:hypothetical protein